MLLTKREEQLLKAFLEYGRLSVDTISDILQVSRRTVYRTLSDLAVSLNQLDIDLIKKKNKYYLSGDLEKLSSFSSQQVYSRKERLQLVTYRLLSSTDEVTNEDLQTLLGVSNVTIIQDIAEVEKRLSDFAIVLERKRGYRLILEPTERRRLMAILLTNMVSLPEFWNQDYLDLDGQLGIKIGICKQVFQAYQEDLPDMDSKLSQYFIFLLALANSELNQVTTASVSKTALEFSQKVFTELAQRKEQFYSLQEVLYFASALDDLVIRRQETPLFNETFDSNFFYNVSNLIDKAARYTKINFAKDKLLFRFLFNHIRLNLAVPTLFEDSNNVLIAHKALDSSEYLHRVVSLLVKEIFPPYLQSESEYELITLHFAASLRRSPDIYPIQLLLLTDERPLATELLITRIKTIAPFVNSISRKMVADFQEADKDYFDCILSTKAFSDESVKWISIYPETKELLELQDYLQYIQLHREIKIREISPQVQGYNLQEYFVASQALLEEFSLQGVNNPNSFEETVSHIVDQIAFIHHRGYLSSKLLQRFTMSPLAIPETNLALLHTYSSKITKSCFKIFDLANPVMARSMNHGQETISRVLVMLIRLDEDEAMRELMTAISQSIIENNLYTEIYKAGNRDIIYQLLNQIFSEKIKKLEN